MSYLSFKCCEMQMQSSTASGYKVPPNSLLQRFWELNSYKQGRHAVYKILMKEWRTNGFIFRKAVRKLSMSSRVENFAYLHCNNGRRDFVASLWKFFTQILWLASIRFFPTRKFFSLRGNFFTCSKNILFLLTFNFHDFSIAFVVSAKDVPKSVSKEGLLKLSQFSDEMRSTNLLSIRGSSVSSHCIVKLILLTAWNLSKSSKKKQ